MAITKTNRTKLVAKRNPLPESVIYIPDDARKKIEKDEGIVVIVGSDCQDAKIGDNIVWGKYAGLPLLWEKEENLILLDEADILYWKNEEES